MNQRNRSVGNGYVMRGNIVTAYGIVTDLKSEKAGYNV